MEFQRFEPTILRFLEDLADNNNRPWFQENKARYEDEVLEPCMTLIRAFAPRLKKISEFFVASDRRVGGSLMRVYRDTRFFKGQEPYKTNVGIQFRHEFGRDIHAPGFYVHIAPQECFLAVGVWHPDSASLGKIRQAIVDRPDRWRRARRDKRFLQCFELEGGSLKRLSLPTFSPQILQFACQFCTADESVEAFPTAPDRNPPRFTIALAANEATKLGHPAIELTHGHLLAAG